MRFPYQKNLGSTLRDFAGVQRHQSYARTLGLSSITKGEGSLDLLPTDESTTPEASIGDLPDGSQGVGARIDGTMVNLATWSKGQVEGIATQISGLQTTVANQATQISGLQTTVANQATQISGLQTRVTNAETRLDAHASRIGAVENKNTSQDTRLDDHASRLGNHQNRIEALERGPSVGQ